MGLLVKLIENFVSKATIRDKKQIAPHVFHIQIEGKALQQEHPLGYTLRILVGKDKDLGFDDNIRSYSTWRVNKERGVVDMAICTHGNGSGSQWARDCHVGDKMAFIWQKTNAVLDESAEAYLFIGDLSALGHLYALNRVVPTSKKISSFIYGADKEDFFSDINGTTPFAFHEIKNDPSAEIIKSLPRLISGLPENTSVYIMGDSRVCVQLTNYFRKDLNWNSRRIKAKPFWNPLKKGLE
jgi:NADPH-dependent ferric siderophore reductase